MAISALLFTLISSFSSSSSLSLYDPSSHLSIFDSSLSYSFSKPDYIVHRVGFVSKVPLKLKIKGLRVIITGGAGFVGSHLMDRLIVRGDSVTVVDNFFTRRKENMMHHFGNPRFELIRHGVVESFLLDVDQIYHLGSQYWVELELAEGGYGGCHFSSQRISGKLSKRKKHINGLNATWYFLIGSNIINVILPPIRPRFKLAP